MLLYHLSNDSWIGVSSVVAPGGVVVLPKIASVSVGKLRESSASVIHFVVMMIKSRRTTITVNR